MSKFYTIALCILMVSLIFVGEAEGRRKILRGRKTITRTYYKEAAIPAWAVVAIVAVVEIILGCVIYVVLNRFYVGNVDDIAVKAEYRAVKTA